MIVEEYATAHLIDYVSTAFLIATVLLIYFLIPAENLMTKLKTTLVELFGRRDAGTVTTGVQTEEMVIEMSSYIEVEREMWQSQQVNDDLRDELEEQGRLLAYYRRISMPNTIHVTRYGRSYHRNRDCQAISARDVTSYDRCGFCGVEEEHPNSHLL